MAKAAKITPSLEPESLARILAVVAQSDEPLTLKQISAALGEQCVLTDKQLKPALADLVASGKLREFAPLKGKAIRVWDRGLEVLLPRLVLAKLEFKGPCKLADLKKLVLKEVKGLSDAQFQAAFDEHRAAGRVFEHPPLTSTSKLSTWATYGPNPSDYLKAVTKDLAKVATKYAKIVSALSAAGVSDDELTAAGRRMFEAAGFPDFLLTSRSSTPSKPVSVDLIELMRLVEPRASSGALVTTPELRRAAGLSKADFDREILRLARDGKLVLHRHDFAGGLTETERSELVQDETGTFYIGVGLRSRNR